MPAWPGGPCPECGEDMPPKLIRCVSCRTLLNEDLQPDSVEIPKFEPLKEIAACVETEPRGYFVICPYCDKELKINRRYLGKKLSCKSCDRVFRLELDSETVKCVGFYLNCPHCDDRLRARMKYLGLRVVCKSCSNDIEIVK